MITGFNTDVCHRDRVFHVQTEDKGRSNPIVESLIYCSGEILTSSRTPYRMIAESESYSEEVVLGLMEAQHQSLIRDIRAGKFDDEGPKPFGHDLVSDRGLDEVVLEALIAGADKGRIRLRWIDEQDLCDGTSPALRISVVEDAEGRPVPGAEVRVKLLTRNEQPRVLFSGATDDNGFVEASIEIPESGVGPSVVLCEAVAGDARDEFRQPVKRSTHLA